VKAERGVVWLKERKREENRITGEHEKGVVLAEEVRGTGRTVSLPAHRGREVGGKEG
jgi:hypothetical protein